MDTIKSSVELQPHQQRVVTERDDLNIKINALDGFIKGSLIFHNLPKDEQALLKRQCEVMKEYSDILQSRINAFIA